MKKNIAHHLIYETVETPALIVERDVLNSNLRRIAAIAKRHGTILRPHVKTHKSLWLAGLQVQSGASGLTVAKPSEALVFLQGGFDDITVAYPLLDAGKLDRLFETARRFNAKLQLVADSRQSIDALAAAATKAGLDVHVLVEIDVGLHRCGIAPEKAAATELIALIDAAPHLSFAGIFSHAGHSYHAENSEQIAAIAEDERRTMCELANALRTAGIAVPAVSVGATPTVIAGRDFDGITEIRPGNAVFMDMTQVALDIATRADIALTVIATVVSVNDSFAIVDAGSKTLSSDQGPHGSKAITGYGLATPLNEPDRELSIVALSEEHGFIRHDQRPLAVGERVRIWPNHACPVINLADSFTVVDADGTSHLQRVDARGCTI